MMKQLARNFKSVLLSALLPASILGLTLLSGCEKAPSEQEEVVATEKPQAEQTQSTESRIGIPDFKNIQIIGVAGEGAVSDYLKEFGAEQAGDGAAGNVQLVHISTDLPVEKAVEAIKNGLSGDKYLIIDAKGNEKDSVALNAAMSSAVGMSIEGMAAYMVHESKKDEYEVTPLLSIKNAQGEYETNQLKVFLDKPVM